MDKATKKIILVTLIYTIICAAIIFFGVVPNFNKYFNSSRKLNEAEQLVASNENREKQLAALEQNAAETNNLTLAVNALWPDSEEVGSFIVQIESLAKEKQIVLDSLSITEKPATGKKNNDDANNETTAKSTDSSNTGIPFSLDTKCSYETALGIVQGLEKLVRFNTVSSISLGSLSNGQLSLKISGMIYAK